MFSGSAESLALVNHASAWATAVSWGTHPSFWCEQREIPLNTLTSRARSFWAGIRHDFHSFLRLECDIEAELSQTLHQPVANFIAVHHIDEVHAQLLVMTFMLQHVVGRDQYAVGYRH